MPNSSETVSESRSTETKTEESLVVFHVDSKNPQAPAKAKPEVKRRRILFESTCEDPEGLYEKGVTEKVYPKKGMKKPAILEEEAGSFSSLGSSEKELTLFLLHRNEGNAYKHA